MVEILGLVLVLAVVVILSRGIRIVPQGSEWIVERLGKFHKVLKPGFHIIIPIVDRVAYKVPTKELILDIPSQEVITKDNAVVRTNAVVFVKVTDPIKAVYNIENFRAAAANLTMTTLRAVIGEMNLDEALYSRERIKGEIKRRISDEFATWGMTLNTVEIQDILPSDALQRAMDQQAAAERQRKALVIKAEGEKEAHRLKAEGEMLAAERQAKAQIELAKASKEAIELVAAAIQNRGTEPVVYLLGQKYIETLTELTKSSNGKFILLPADIMATVQRLFGSTQQKS